MHENATASIRFVPTEFAGYGSLMGFHRQLLFDSVRTNAFLHSVAAVVRPGDVVVDLGTGTGILALAACRAGAARVYAIDHDSIWHVASSLAQQNGFSDRIAFISADARSVNLPQSVDVVVSECLGLMGIGGTMVPAVMDLAQRSLKPGGRVIPGNISAFLAPAESALNTEYVSPWTMKGPGDFDFSPLRGLARNNVYISTMTRANLIADQQRLFHVNLRDGSWKAETRADVVFHVNDAREFHGYCGWFEATLCDDITLNTSPGHPPTVWEQLFLPLEHELRVDPGDDIRVAFAVAQSGVGLPIAFVWNTTVTGPNGDIKAAFRQTTDRSVPW